MSMQPYWVDDYSMVYAIKTYLGSSGHISWPGMTVWNPMNMNVLIRYAKRENKVSQNTLMQYAFKTIWFLNFGVKGFNSRHNGNHFSLFPAEYILFLHSYIITKTSQIHSRKRFCKNVTWWEWQLTAQVNKITRTHFFSLILSLNKILRLFTSVRPVFE